MNYLNQLLGIFRQFTRPIFSHLRNSLPVLLTLGLILILIISALLRFKKALK